MLIFKPVNRYYLYIMVKDPFNMIVHFRKNLVKTLRLLCEFTTAYYMLGDDLIYKESCHNPIYLDLVS